MRIGSVDIPSSWPVAFAGCAVALMAGLSTGGYFRIAPAGFERPFAGSGGLVFGDETAAPVAFMTDSAGRIPDYVLGTDFTRLPAMEVAYTPEPETPMELWSPPAQVEAQPVAFSPAPPPSVSGDILAGVHISAPSSAVAETTTAEPEDPPSPIVLEDGADPAAFTPRPPQPVAVAAAY